MKNINMEDMMGQRKIGARTLSIEEIKLILPTYEKLLAQLEEIRSSNEKGNNEKDNSEKSNNEKSNSKKGNNDLDDMQKTNNIAILGERGSGKSSVLKTIFQYLNDKNAANKQNSGMNIYITLPIIIPENMSESSNLIATILGLFKGELNKIKENSAKNQMCSITDKPTELEQEYNKLIKRYCYIQKEFRDVLVSEFTTENDYVKKSSEIFISDIEFIGAFNSFINTLVEDKAYEKNPMIVFFIDDIDLSTIRCTDIVKTLLSYISHKNIITFISGDLNTFEEALTIDFLRQENVLDRDLFEQSFLEDGSELLERKKLLSYEYLKKVIPPVFRHNVKKWSLVDRGNYFIKEDKTNPIKMVDLLTSTLGKFVDKSYFKYICFEGNSETEKPIPQMFNILDKTSRGLNNVYNLLLDTKDILTQDDNDNNQYDKFIAVKMLIETIISSNPELNKYREALLGQVINFGTDFQSTVIRVDNFEAVVSNIELDADNSKVLKNKLTVATKFSLFALLDLCIRTLKQTSLLDDAVYKSMYKMAIACLINNPTISDSSVVINDGMINYIRMSPDDIFAIVSQLPPSETQKNIVKVLEDSSFPFSLTLYQYLSQYGYKIFFRCDDNNDFQYILNVYDSYRSISILDNKQIEYVVSEAAAHSGRIFGAFSKLISPNNLRNTVRNVFSNIISSKKIFNGRSPMSQTLMTNFLVSVTEGLSFESERLVPVNKKSDFYLSLSKKLETNMQVKVLLDIALKNLWGNFEVVRVRIYIMNKVRGILKRLSSGSYKIDISCLVDSYNKFMHDTYKGVSYTKAENLASILRALLHDFGRTITSNFIDFGTYSEIKKQVESLANNYQVWYGNSEARSMSYALDNATYAFFDNDDNKIDDYEELQMWMHFYAADYAYNNNMEDIYLQSGKLAGFSDIIRRAENMSEQEDITNFMDKLNEGSEEHISIEDFDRLFTKTN